MYRNVHTKNGLSIEAKLLKTYHKRGTPYEPQYHLLFAQDRLVVTDADFNELNSLDVLPLLNIPQF